MQIQKKTIIFSGLSRGTKLLLKRKVLLSYLTAILLASLSNYTPQLPRHLIICPRSIPVPLCSLTLTLHTWLQNRWLSFYYQYLRIMATGYHGISARLLKIAAPAIANPLSRLINYCISTQTFPLKWKIAKVTPVFKGQGSNDDKEYYRPILGLCYTRQFFQQRAMQCWR